MTYLNVKDNTAKILYNVLKKLKINKWEAKIPV